MKRAIGVRLMVSVVAGALLITLASPAVAAPEGPVEFVLCFYETRDSSQCPRPVDEEDIPGGGQVPGIDDLPGPGGIPGPGDLPGLGDLPGPGDVPQGPSDLCLFDFYPVAVFCVMNGEPTAGGKARGAATYLRNVPVDGSMIQRTLEHCYYDNPNPDKVARARCIVLTLAEEAGRS